MIFDPATEPLSNVRWRAATELRANDYNPNMVMRPELESLLANILRHGWLQPVIANAGGLLIDGFHRWRLSRESKALHDRYHGMLPVVELPLSEDMAIVLTVRMNRAKGVHAATRMASLVRRLEEEHDWSRVDIAREIGGTLDEVNVLADDDLFTSERLEKHVYSKAWYPGESRHEGA